jgi:hypothetical protein
MKRWLFHILAALSLLLCVGSAGLWIRNMRTLDTLGCQTAVSDSGRQLGASVHALYGAIECEFWIRHYGRDYRPTREPRFAHFTTVIADTSSIRADRREWIRLRGGFQCLGFALARHDSSASVPIKSDGSLNVAVPQSSQVVILPHWGLTLFFGLLPLAWLHHHRRSARRRRRAAAGLCADCGYDLRASTDCCPECGAAIDISLLKPASS